MPKRVVFVVYQDLQILDLTGPFEVFALANRLTSGRRPEDVRGEGTTVGQNGRRAQRGPDSQPAPTAGRAPTASRTPRADSSPTAGGSPTA